MDTRVKIKFLRNLRQEPDEVIARVLNLVDLTIRDVYYTREQVTLQLHSITDVDRLMTDNVTDSLLSHNLKVIAPRGYLASRTVFMTKLTDYFTKHTEKDIITEINSHNSVTAKHVFIIQGKMTVNNTNNPFKTLKVIFSSTEDADKVITNGIKMFNVSLTCENLRKENPLNIIQCFRCLKFRHPTYKCKEQNNTCSLCAGQHNYRYCTNPTHLKCSNCGNEHAAIDFRCPSRKSYIQELQTNRREGSSTLPKQTTPIIPPPPHTSLWQQNTSALLPTPVNNTKKPALLPTPINNTKKPALLPTPVHTTIIAGPSNTPTPEPVNITTTITSPSTNISNTTPTQSLPPTHPALLNAHLMVAIEYAKLRAANDHDCFSDIMEEYFTMNSLPAPKLPKKGKGKSKKSTKNTATPIKNIQKTNSCTSPTLPEEIVRNNLPFSLETPSINTYDPLLGSINFIDASPPQQTTENCTPDTNSLTLKLSADSNATNTNTAKPNNTDKITFSLGSIADINTQTQDTQTTNEQNNTPRSTQCDAFDDSDTVIDIENTLSESETVTSYAANATNQCDISFDNEITNSFSPLPHTPLPSPITNTRSPYALRNSCTIKTPMGTLTLHKQE